MSRTSVCRGTFCFAILLIATLTSSSASADPAKLSAFEGTWVRDDIARDDAAREAEIERITQPMSVLTRGFARSLMKRRMRPDASVQIRSEGAGLGVVAAKQAALYIETSGRQRSTEHGEVSDRLLPDGAIVRAWRRGSGEGHGTIVWQLSPGGERLFVRATAFNPHFDGSIEYTTSYRRVPDDRRLRARGEPAPGAGNG